MSRGFVKEGDQEEAPIIPPRAALPANVTNYVRPQGFKALEEELKELEAQRQNTAEMSEAEARRHKMLVDGKINLLKERLASARILNPADQPQDEVRFGATVKVQYLQGPLKGKAAEFTITGIDEADVQKQKIAFIAPLARALAGAKEGEECTLNLGGEVRKLKVLKISYAN